VEKILEVGYAVGSQQSEQPHMCESLTLRCAQAQEDFSKENTCTHDFDRATSFKLV